MKFPKFKELKLRATTNTDVLIKRIWEFLNVELATNFRELVNGLSKLNFIDNFESFEVDIEIEAGQELAIRNELIDIVPSRRIIVRSNGNSIVDGDKEWTKDYVYLKNIGTTKQTARVIFLR